MTKEGYYFGIAVQLFLNLKHIVSSSVQFPFPTTDSLRAGGSTGMLDGIMDALKEILQNGQLLMLL